MSYVSGVLYNVLQKYKWFSKKKKMLFKKINDFYDFLKNCKLSIDKHFWTTIVGNQHDYKTC